MLFTNALVAFVAAAASSLTSVSATPAAVFGRGDWPQAPPGLNCYFIAHPGPELYEPQLQGSLDYAIGHTLSEHWVGHLAQDNNTLTRNAEDGTYSVLSHVLVQDIDNDEVAAFVKGWTDTSLDGMGTQWAIRTAYCHVRYVNGY